MVYLLAVKKENILNQRINLPPGLRLAVLIAHNYECIYCDCKATEVDHIKPVAEGGTNSPYNLLPACRKHNNWKSAKMLFNIDFYLAIAADHAPKVYANWERKIQVNYVKIVVRATKTWWIEHTMELIRLFRKYFKKGKECIEIIAKELDRTNHAVICKLAKLGLYKMVT